MVRVDLEFLRAPPLVSEYGSEEDWDEEDVQSRSGVRDEERLSNCSSEDDDDDENTSSSSHPSSPITSHHREMDDNQSVGSVGSRVSSSLGSSSTPHPTMISFPKQKKRNFLKVIQKSLQRTEAYILFQLWRERKAKERRHVMLRDLEMKGDLLKKKVYQEIENEIRENEK